MPTSYTFENDILWFNSTGDYSGAGVDRMYRSAFRDRRYNSSTKILHNMLGSTTKLSPAELQDQAELLKRHHGPKRIAAVANRPKVQENAKTLAKIYSTAQPAQYRVFRCIRKAVQWLLGHSVACPESCTGNWVNHTNGTGCVPGNPVQGNGKSRPRRIQGAG